MLPTQRESQVFLHQSCSTHAAQIRQLFLQLDDALKYPKWSVGNVIVSKRLPQNAQYQNEANQVAVCDSPQQTGKLFCHFNQ